MEKIKLDDLSPLGLPLYRMKKIFKLKGSFEDISLTEVILLPGQRVPKEGTGSHEEDEYSIFLEGEVYTESGDYKGICQKGDATLIPKGEAHWSENRTDKACRLICLLVK